MSTCMVPDSGDDSKVPSSTPAPESLTDGVHWEVPIVASWTEGSRYLGVRLAVPPELDRLFTQPGQYVVLRLREEARFFVIAHRGGSTKAPIWEFLIDAEGYFGSLLATSPEGARLKISAPLGDGFEQEEVPQRALLFCTGSGVAAMRPLIEAWIEGKERPEEIYLYLGVQARSELPYEALLDEWRAAGVEVAIACGEGPVKRRFVQHLYLEAPVPLANALVYLSGAPAMSAAVKKVLSEVGLNVKQVRTNL